MEEKMINIDQATRVTYGNDYDMQFFGEGVFKKKNFGEGVLKEYREMETKKKRRERKLKVTLFTSIN